MTRKEKAVKYFTDGYNCSQAVALAFSDLTDYDEKTLAKLASSFGGGMGRLREVCGAVTGMFIIAGILYGYDNPNDTEKKAEHYARIQNLAEKFKEKNGTIVCRELLGIGKTKESPMPDKRTEEYYKKRPCKDMVAQAAEILDEYILENGVSNS